MMKTLGFVEFKSIAMGMEATDEMLKSSNVRAVLSTAMCPGKYITLIEGDVDAVKNAVRVGKSVGDIFTIDGYVLSNIHPDVFPALGATIDINRNIDSIGVIETMSAISSIIAGDVAAKAGNIELLEIRLARGLGGKGFTVITGEIASVKAAIAACEAELEKTGDVVYSTVISAPNKQLIDNLL